MPEEPRKVPVGSQAPDFALEGAAGSVRLADYRGQVAVLLVFMRAFG
jgi:peroxiredoxin